MDSDNDMGVDSDHEEDDVVRLPRIDYVVKGDYDRTDPDCVLIVAMAAEEGIHATIGPNGETLLRRAIEKNKPSAVKFLVSQGCGVSQDDYLLCMSQKDRIPLLTAIISCRDKNEGVEKLLTSEFEMVLDKKERHYVTLMAMAKYLGYTDVVQYFTNANIVKMPTVNPTRLMTLIKERNEKMIHILLTDLQDTTPLMTKGPFEVESGLYLEMTPLSYAIYIGQTQNDTIFKILHSKASSASSERMFPVGSTPEIIQCIRAKNHRLLSLLTPYYHNLHNDELNKVLNSDIRAKIDNKGKNKYTVTPLAMAKYTKDVKILAHVQRLQATKMPKVKTEEVLLLIKEKNVAMLNILLEKGTSARDALVRVRINGPANVPVLGETINVLPLVYAIHLAYTEKTPEMEEIVKLLMDRGAHPTSRCDWLNGSNISPVDLAYSQGRCGYLEQMFTADPASWYTMECVEKSIEGGKLGNDDFVELLNKFKVAGNAISDTSVHLACVHGRADYVEAIHVVFGDMINIFKSKQFTYKNKSRTAPQLCCLLGKLGCLEVLYENGWKLDLTCVDCAIEGGQGGILKYLYDLNLVVPSQSLIVQKVRTKSATLIQKDHSDIISFLMVAWGITNTLTLGQPSPPKRQIQWSPKEEEDSRNDAKYDIENDASTVMANLYYFSPSHNTRGKSRGTGGSSVITILEDKHKIREDTTLSKPNEGRSYKYRFFMFDCGADELKDLDKNTILEILKHGGGTSLCPHWYDGSDVEKYLKKGEGHYIFLAYRLNSFTRDEEDPIYERIDAISLVSKTGSLYFTISIFCINQRPRCRGLGHLFMPFILDCLGRVAKEEPGRCLVSLHSSTVAESFYGSGKFVDGKPFLRCPSERLGLQYMSDFYYKQGARERKGVCCTFHISLCGREEEKKEQFDFSGPPSLRSRGQSVSFFGYPAVAVPECQKCQKRVKIGS